MLLRPYVPGDWQRLCYIHDAARLLELRASGMEQAFLDLQQTAQGEGLFDSSLIVAEVDGEVEGFVAFAESELNWLYVNPAMHRRGIGRALVRHALGACKGEMSAEVLVGNDAALQLYRSEGFEVLERIDGRLTGNEAFAASGYVLRRAKV
jgi:ribosomal protein S18 acetylase RimI-like enzyme